MRYYKVSGSQLSTLLDIMLPKLIAYRVVTILYLNNYKAELHGNDVPVAQCNMKYSKGLPQKFSLACGAGWVAF